MSDTDNSLNTFTESLDAGWAEASATTDRVANTKVVLSQVLDAKKALSKVIAVAARIGGPKSVIEAGYLGEDINTVLGNCNAGALVIALGLHTIPQLDALANACKEGIQNEEVIRNSGN